MHEHRRTQVGGGLEQGETVLRSVEVETLAMGSYLDSGKAEPRLRIAPTRRPPGRDLASGGFLDLRNESGARLDGRRDVVVEERAQRWLRAAGLAQYAEHDWHRRQNLECSTPARSQSSSRVFDVE